MKLSNFSANYFVKSALVVLALSFSSCISKKVEDENKVFHEKFATDLEGLKISRVDPRQTQLDGQKLDFTAPIDQDSQRYTNSNITIPEYYTTQQFSNQQMLQAGFQAPVEMFENSYSPSIAVPFRKIGAEFDTIDVPSQDAYGIKSGMSQKEYLLGSRKLLQKNVDQINGQRTSDDVDNSETLINEQRKLKRRVRMIKAFGQESVTVEDEAKAVSKKGDLADKKKIVKAKKEADKNKPADQKAAETPPAQPAFVQPTAPKNSATFVPQAPLNEVAPTSDAPALELPSVQIPTVNNSN